MGGGGTVERREVEAVQERYLRAVLVTGEVHTYSRIFRQETKTEKILLGSGERYIKYEDMKKRLEDQKTHYLRSAEGSLIGKNEIT